MRQWAAVALRWEFREIPWLYWEERWEEKPRGREKGSGGQRRVDGVWSVLQNPLCVFWVLLQGGNCFHIQRSSSSSSSSSLHAFLFPIVLVTDFRFRVSSESLSLWFSQHCVFLTERQKFLIVFMLTQICSSCFPGFQRYKASTFHESNELSM